jgi:hypothetical protein
LLPSEREKPVVVQSASRRGWRRDALQRFRPLDTALYDAVISGGLKL